jgi:hypothetical protein
VAVCGGGHQFYNNLIYNSGKTGVTGPSGTSSPGIFKGINLGLVSQGKNCPADTNHVYNNTTYNLIDSGSHAILSTQTGTVNVKNNIGYLTGLGFVGGTQSKNLTSNPSFVDAPNANFHLQSGSVALDAGMTVPGVTVDFAGRPRPQGTAFDIGAYEGEGESASGAPAAPMNLTVR